MRPLYGPDLAWIQAEAFGGLARAVAPHVIEVLRRSGARQVVEIGCGAGPLTALLVAEGFDVFALDPSAPLLEYARAAAPTSRFVQGSAYEVELPRCDAILAIGEPLTYHDEPERAEARLWDFLERGARALRPGGVLIFDLIETGEPTLTARSWASGDDWAVLVDTREEAGSRSLSRRIEFFRREGDLYTRGYEVHHVRLFDAGEVCRRLNQCGFSVETAVAYGTQSLLPRRRAFFGTRREHPA